MDALDGGASTAAAAPGAAEPFQLSGGPGSDLGTSGLGAAAPASGGGWEQHDKGWGWSQGDGWANSSSGNAGGSAAVAQGESAPPSDNLYIKGFPAESTEASVREIIGAYGTVTSVRLLPAPAGVRHDPSMYLRALVRMGGVDQAQWMVDNLDGNIPQGLSSPIIVKFANSGMRRNEPASGFGAINLTGKGYDPPRYSPYGDGAASGKGAGSSKGGKGDSPLKTLSSWATHAAASAGLHTGSNNSNLYVKGLPPTADELYLYKVCAPFGGIVSVKAMMGDQGECLGIGFVKFADDAEAQIAIASLSGAQLPDGSVIHLSVKTVTTGTHSANYPTEATGMIGGGSLPGVVGPPVLNGAWPNQDSIKAQQEREWAREEEEWLKGMGS